MSETGRKALLWLCIVQFFCLAFAQESSPQENKGQSQETFLLYNTDKVSGTLRTFEEEIVYLDNPEMGEIKIAWKDIQGIIGKRVLSLRIANGNVISGRPLGILNDQQIVDTVATGKVAINRNQIVMVGISPEDVDPEYRKRQKEIEKGKKEAALVKSPWSGYLEASFSGNEGNKNDRTFIAIGHIERKGERDKFEAHLFSKYASAAGEEIANQIKGHIRESFDITPRFYMYARAEGEHDELADIDFRLTLELGVGLHILKEGDWELFAGDKVTLDWDLGGHYTGTDYHRPNKDTNQGGLITRITYLHIFPNQWKLGIMGEYKQSFQEPPQKRNASSVDDYTLIGEVRLEIPVSGILSFTGSIRDEYVNAPAAGKKRNDFYWYFGLKISL